MPNASGVNQFGGFPETIPYGDKARQGTLQRLAPMAGTPVPEPRRASQDRHPSAAPEQQPDAIAAAPAVPGAAIPPAELYTAIASIPGASDLVKGIFGGSA